MSAIAASYARYSSDLQDVSSIAQQQRKCRDAAAANGHTLDPDLEFADEAVSGTKRQRDGLNALLAAAKAGRFGVVYFESLSRLARESVITMPLLKELVYVHRVRIVSVSEGIDSNNGSWDLVASIMAAVHEQFLKGLRAAVLRGQEQAVLADWSAGHWCFGYGSEPIPGTETARRGRHPRPRMRVVVNPDHAEWVRRIFRWFADDGRSLDAIARELTRRNAPKDHRSTTAGWHHDYVRRVLRNEKYIGLWHWGRATNVRNPLTGQIAQEGRSPEEAAKWVRERTDLRIVDDALYFRAQAKLDENEAAWDTLRAEKGRFRGSRAGTAAGRHLLQGVFRCGACGGTFQVNGANGKYLGCAGYKKGLCGWKTRLPRARAEALLLGVIRDRVLGRPEWVAEVVAEARRAWREQRAGAEDPIAEIMKTLAAVEAGIGRLVDKVEAGTAGPELDDRLRQRRSEKLALERDLARARAEAATDDGPPTAEWVAAKLRDLGDVFSAGGDDANAALRDLVGGGVTLTEASADGRKRKFLIGTFALDVTTLVRGTSGISQGEPIRLEFADAPPWADVADRVKALIDAGREYRAIAAELGCTRSWVAKALAHWHRERGLPAPDGRTTKARLARPSQAEALAEDAKVLWDGGLEMHAIAARLGCHRDTVTAAVRHWFASRGQPVPDGRHRRKELRQAGFEDVPAGEIDLG